MVGHCHNRTDYPDLDSALQVNFYTQLDDNDRPGDPWRMPVPPVSDELRPWLDRAGPIEVAGRLLE